MADDQNASFSSVVSATNRNLTRLSRNVALTASAVMSGSDPASLAAPSAYHRAMSEVTTYRRRLVASKIKENTPRQAIKETVISRLGGTRAPQIADELLIDLPQPRASHSLFQTFEVTAPKQSNGTVDQTPHALAVRKEMAASELVDIDERIAELKAMRKIVFDRMADVERIQISDEPSLQHFYPAGEKIKSFTPQDGAEVRLIDFNSPFGQLALVYGDKIELYELNSDSHSELMGTEGQVKRCLTVHGSDPVVTCGAGNNVCQWSGSDRECAAFLGHVGPVLGVSCDGESVASTSEDKTVRHWDQRLGKCLQTIDSFQFGCCRSLQHLGSALATGSDDGVVRLWDLRTGSMAPQRELLGGHTGSVNALHFTGLELVSGSQDGSVRIWDLRTGQISHAEAYSGPVTSLSFDATKVVTSIMGDRGVQVLSRPTMEHRINAISDHPVTASKYMKGYLVTGRASGEVGVYAI